jgi:hypothetical protein
MKLRKWVENLVIAVFFVGAVLMMYAVGTLMEKYSPGGAAGFVVSVCALMAMYVLVSVMVYVLDKWVFPRLGGGKTIKERVE